MFKLLIKVYIKNSLKDKVQNDFLDFQPITVIETKQILKRLNTNKSTALNGKFLELSSDYIAEPISYLIIRAYQRVFLQIS